MMEAAENSTLVVFINVSTVCVCYAVKKKKKEGRGVEWRVQASSTFSTIPSLSLVLR